MLSIAIFASGTGTNAAVIINYFRHHPSIKTGLVVCNKEQAGVLDIAAKNGIPVVVVSKQQLNDEQYFMGIMQEHGIDYIVLAGFLLLIPAFLVGRFGNRIFNIHPALLPKYGGKGMYGMKVHQAVHDNREPETGITIHFVNEHYDEGKVLAQYSVAIAADDTPELIAKKVQVLEHKYFPIVIEEAIKSS
jgi:phosphoribosylglycinamide formyltransferase-1